MMGRVHNQRDYPGHPGKKRPRAATVTFEPYRYGGAFVRFADPVLHRQAVRAMRVLTASERKSYLDSGVIIQSDEALAQILENHLDELDELLKGYTIRIKMDPWAAAHLYGYDAHTAFE